jgi:hypothetical protein
MNPFETLPNFLIIGAAKAGTTTLYDLLKQHPQVYLSFVKEPMYFSHDDNYRRGPEWYARTYFRDAESFPARGEATPHYLYWSEKAAPRIREVYGQAPIRFIVILRDPVSRAYSWYWNMIKEGTETLPFEEALKLEDQRLQEHWKELEQIGGMVYGYLRGSRYAEALQPFLERFPRKDLLFLLQEDLSRNFASTIRTLLEFLELDVNVPINPAYSNQATMPRSRHVQTWLRGRSPFREFFKRLIPLRLRYGLRTRLLEANARPAEYPKIDPSTEAELRLRLAPEVRRLEQVIGRDLSAWLPR